MRVLLDENLPHRLRQAIVDHDVSTVAYMGWSGVRNGELIKLAEAEGFEVLVTADQNIEYQQNLKDRKIAVVCVTAQLWEVPLAYLTAITEAVNASSAGSYRAIDCDGHEN